MATLSALVKPIRAAEIDSHERRHAERQNCHVEGVTRPMESLNGLSWGAIVKDISTTGVGLSVCFPFRLGTYLIVDLEGQGQQPPRSLLAKVAHVHDQRDGTWLVGCELVRRLAERDVQAIV